MKALWCKYKEWPDGHECSPGSPVSVSAHFQPGSTEAADEMEETSLQKRNHHPFPVGNFLSADLESCGTGK